MSNRPDEALQAIERAYLLDFGRTPAYRDALAHALLKSTRAGLSKVDIEVSRSRLSRAEILISENLRDFPDEATYHKIAGETAELAARLALIEGNLPLALEDTERANAMFLKAADLLPRDIQIKQLALQNDLFEFSIYMHTNQWDRADQTLARMEQRLQEHQMIRSQAPEYWRFPSLFWEAKFVLAVRREDDSRAVQAARSWSEAALRAVEAHPGHLWLQRDLMYATAITRHLYPGQLGDGDDAVAIALAEARCQPLDQVNRDSVDYISLDMLAAAIAGKTEHAVQLAAQVLDLIVDGRQDDLWIAPPDLPLLVIKFANRAELNERFLTHSHVQPFDEPALNRYHQLAYWNFEWRRDFQKHILSEAVMIE